MKILSGFTPMAALSRDKQDTLLLIASVAAAHAIGRRRT